MTPALLQGFLLINFTGKFYIISRQFFRETVLQPSRNWHLQYIGL